ncbi:histone-lysine N-methyltransferase SETMAR [Trichonephila clavipes]|uniref:Histone-lysine N-methyltransferase SETMAR n=1 Tax=Trichonephila clavipes TaxID=2585209 RepID=A0A8X6V7N6_TRICX|nr:histone-lysine N-methyltransferase SETMAR [Trichonephila clavipes]
MPDHIIFQWLHRQFRETRSFHITRHGADRRKLDIFCPSLEESVLNAVADRSESSTRGVTHHVSGSYELQGVKNGSQQRENVVILQFFFDKAENANQVAEIVNGVYGADTVTAIYVQFWFRRFRSGIFDVKDAPRTVRPVFNNVDKITEIIEVSRLVTSCSITRS